MTSAAPAILALETDSSWVVILVVSLVTLPAALILRRLIAKPGGLASGLFLSLPLALPLIAALSFQNAVFPEISLLRPVGPSVFEQPGALLHVLLVQSGDRGAVTPYALVGSAGPWLLLIGLGVSTFMLLRRAAGAWLVHRLIVRCEPVEDRAVLRTVTRLSLDAPLAKAPEVLLLPVGMSGAFAVGGRKGRILISANLVAELESDELEGILAHEIAHLQARDVHVVFTAGLLRDMVAWNPFAHIAYRKLLTDRELEADRRAAAITGRPLSVASGLLKVCEISRHAPRFRQRMALGFLKRGGRVSRRVMSLIKLSDSRAAVSVDSIGRLPYLMAACLVAVLGLQAGSRIAGLGDGAFGLMWGDSDAAETTWRPHQADLPAKALFKSKSAEAGKHTMKIIKASIAMLREDPAVIPPVRPRDINDYMRYVRHVTVAAHNAGIPTATVDKHEYRAVPILPVVGGRLVSIREAI